MTWQVIHRGRYVCDQCGKKETGWSDELPLAWVWVEDERFGPFTVGTLCPECKVVEAPKEIA